MIHVPKRFKTHELVDPATFAALGDKALEIFRPEALMVLDELSAFFGDKAITINNWKTDGQFHWRGLRTIECTQGAARGPHRVGAAWDINVAGMTPDEVFAAITGNPDNFPHIRRMEDGAVTTGWTHVDVWEHDAPGILIFKP